MFVYDENHERFYLTRRRTHDEFHYSIRKGTVAAIQKAVKHNWLGIRVGIYRLRNHRRLSTVAIQYMDGSLRLGCHIFGVSQTKKILRWAGVKV